MTNRTNVTTAPLTGPKESYHDIRDDRSVRQQLRDITRPKNLVKISALSALAVLLMVVLQFPIPIAPPFMTIDFGDVPALVGGFALGPVAGILVEGLKILLNLLFTGTMTAGVGEVSNFLLGAMLVGTSAAWYKRHRTRKDAMIALLIGGLSMTALGYFSNTFFVFPAYARAFGMQLSDFAAMAGQNSLVRNYTTLMLFAIVPFNLVKSAMTGILTMLLYKRISPLLHR